MLTLPAWLLLPAMAAPDALPTPPDPVETGLPPALLERTWPEFPAAGKVTDPIDASCAVDVVIDPLGGTRSVTAAACSDLLARPTIEAMQGWRWRPIIVEGHGIEATFRAVLHYTAASQTPASFPETAAIDTTWLEVPRCDVNLTLAEGKLSKMSGSYLPECAPEPHEEPIWPSGVSQEPVACETRFINDRGEITELDLSDCPKPFREAAEATLRSWRWPWYERSATPYDVTLVYRSDSPEVTARPRARSRVSPVFPPEAVTAGFVDASCDVTVVVADDGRVDNVEFRRCHEVFQDAAASALTQWIFDGGGEVPLRLRFRLQGPAARPSVQHEGDQPVAILDTDVAHCAIELSVSGLGEIGRLAANRIPECVARPVGGVDWPSALTDQSSCSVAFDVTDGVIGRVSPLDCPGPLKRVAKRSVERWEYPEIRGVQHFEVRIVYRPAAE